MNSHFCGNLECDKGAISNQGGKDDLKINKYCWVNWEELKLSNLHIQE